MYFCERTTYIFVSVVYVELDICPQTYRYLTHILKFQLFNCQYSAINASIAVGYPNFKPMGENRFS